MELSYFEKCLKGICSSNLFGRVLIVVGRSLLCSGIVIVYCPSTTKGVHDIVHTRNTVIIDIFIWFSLLPKQMFLKSIFRENDLNACYLNAFFKFNVQINHLGYYTMCLILGHQKSKL